MVECILATPRIRLLVVEDHDHFRGFISSILQKKSGLQIVCELADGLEAVQQAEKLQPDLILLDINLPGLSGIEAAQRIRMVAPDSKILFLSMESSPELVREGLNSGGRGYVVKKDAGRDLLAAVEAVVQGKHFVSSSIACDVSGDTPIPGQFRPEAVLVSSSPLRQRQKMGRRHPVKFYGDDVSFLDDFTRFITSALNAERIVIALTTDSHRNSLFRSLQAVGVDVVAAVERKRYLSLDVEDSCHPSVEDAGPSRSAKSARDLIVEAAKTASKKHLHIAVG